MWCVLFVVAELDVGWRQERGQRAGANSAKMKPYDYEAQRRRSYRLMSTCEEEIEEEVG